LREILSSFITNLTVSDRGSILLINTVLFSLIGCPEEITRMTAVSFFRLFRLIITLHFVFSKGFYYKQIIANYRMVENKSRKNFF
jgi:hypothetical protein